MRIVYKEKNPELYNVHDDSYIIEKYNQLVECSNNLLKKINKLEWIIAALVAVIFSIGYCVLLQLCIRWLF